MKVVILGVLNFDNCYTHRHTKRQVCWQCIYCAKNIAMQPMLDKLTHKL